MIRKIGIVLLWCFTIIYAVYIIALFFFTNILVMIVLVLLIIIAFSFRWYKNRHKIWFRRKAKILKTICTKSPDDFQMNGEPLSESFETDNFFIQYEPDTKEFIFSSYSYIILPNYVETWDKAIKDIKALIAKEAPNTRIEINTQGELGKDFTLKIVPKEAKKHLLLALAHLLISLRKQLPNDNRMLSCEFYFKIKVFDTICYGKYDGVRVSKAITISSDGNYSIANGEECWPEDFVKSNPPMSIILQYDLYSIEADMLVSKEEFDAHWKKCQDMCDA